MSVMRKASRGGFGWYTTEATWAEWSAMYKIEFEYFNKTGARIGSGVYYKSYRTESEAVRDAEKIYGNSKRFDWYIVDENN